MGGSIGRSIGRRGSWCTSCSRLGNRRGVPYQMRRVTELLAAGVGPGAVRRSVTGPDLAWTLGGTHRTEEEYRAKMDAIGGPSTTMNARRPSPEKEDA